ncbi:MAG: hypothetical protein ACP5M4_15445 [Acidobacteriaceae bacterium]
MIQVVGCLRGEAVDGHPTPAVWGLSGGGIESGPGLAMTTHAQDEPKETYEAMMANREPDLSEVRVRSKRLLFLVLCGVAALAILAVIWQGRSYINPDGISYLDVAREMLKGDPGAYFHPYWSPLLPHCCPK